MYISGKQSEVLNNYTVMKHLWCSIQLPLWPFLVCLHFSLWLCFCAISLILWKSIQLYWNDCKGLKYCQSFGVLTGAINKTNLFQKIIRIFFIIFQYDEVVRQHFESMCCAHLWFFKIDLTKWCTPRFQSHQSQSAYSADPCL